MDFQPETCTDLSVITQPVFLIDWLTFTDHLHTTPYDVMSFLGLPDTKIPGHIVSGSAMVIPSISFGIILLFPLALIMSAGMMILPKLGTIWVSVLISPVKAAVLLKLRAEIGCIFSKECRVIFPGPLSMNLLSTSVAFSKRSSFQYYSS